MGRPAGSPNRTKAMQAAIRRIEASLTKDGYARIEDMAHRYLTGDDLKVSAAIWLRLMEYKWGKPGDSEAKEAANNTMNVIVLNQQVVRNAEPRPQLLPDSQAS